MIQGYRRVLGTILLVLFETSVMFSPAGAADMEILEVQNVGGGSEKRTEVKKVILPLRAVPREDYASNRENPCGPYAITAILRFAGKNADFHEIARRMTPNDTIGSGLTTLMRELLKGGLRVASKSQAGRDEIVKAIDAGNPVIALVDATGVPHWATVKGYEMKGDEVEAFYLEDTAFAWSERRRGGDDLADGYRMEIGEFAKIWHTPLWPDTLGGIASRAAGYGNTMIVAHLDGGGSSDIPLLAVNPASALSTGLLDAWIGIRDRSFGRTLGGIGQFASGLLMIGPHAVGAGLDFVGKKFSDVGNWMSDNWGPAGTLLGLPARGVGGGLSLVGRGVKNVTKGALGIASRIFG